MVKRDNILVFIQPLTKLAEIPVIDRIVNLQEAVNGRQRGLLVGIFNVTKCNVVSSVDSDCNECTKTGQFNATGIRLYQHT